jgi:hypothetical protein
MIKHVWIIIYRVPWLDHDRVKKSPNPGKFHVLFFRVCIIIARQLKATVSYQDENAISKRQIKKDSTSSVPASLGRNDVSRL